MARGKRIAKKMFRNGNKPRYIHLVQQKSTALKKEAIGSRQAQALFHQHPDPVWWIDGSGLVKGVNARVESVTGYQARELVDVPFSRYFAQRDAGLIERSMLLAIQGGTPQFESSLIDQDGCEIQLNVTFIAVTVDSEIAGIYGIAKDMSERKQIEAELQETNQLITDIFESITDCFFSVDSEWKITYWNKEAERAIGISREDIVGLTLWNAFPNMTNTIAFSKLQETRDERTDVKFELYCEIRHKWYSFHAYPSRTGLYVYFQDITGRKIAEKKVSYMTYHDTLTGLPNSKFFNDRLQKVLARAKTTKQHFGVMFIDLDRFKNINESLGYEAGNRLMVSVSKRLELCFRGDDTICRYDGNNFAILLLKTNRSNVEMIARRVLEEFQKPIECDGQELVVTPSIGISLYPDDGKDSQTLLTNAGTAVTFVKEKGKNHFRFYTEDMNRRTMLMLEQDLRKAIERSQLTLLYQPQVDIRTGQVQGVEALVRWKHDELGMIAPGQFIPMAEENGLIVSIGAWVLETACSQNKAWQMEGLSPISVSVNVSPRQLEHRNIVCAVQHALKTSGLDPCYLTLEITESIEIEDEHSIAVLHELKQLGVRISMDDFGKGFSSLSYLKRFPLNTLKIDQSFVRDCTEDVNGATLVKTIIAMAHDLNLNVIAEGVETKEHLHFLQQNMCNEVQGYLFSEPIAAEQLAEKLNDIQAIVENLRLEREYV